MRGVREARKERYRPTLAAIQEASLDIPAPTFRISRALIEKEEADKKAREARIAAEAAIKVKSRNGLEALRERDIGFCNNHRWCWCHWC